VTSIVVSLAVGALTFGLGMLGFALKQLLPERAGRARRIAGMSSSAA
jgi:hypothetical protein